MPTTITPVSAWTTLETPAGADVANAASVENAVQRLANRVEYLKDKALAGSTSWPQTAGTTISPVDIVPAPVYVAPGGAAAAVALNTQWRAHYTNAVGGGPGGRDLITMTGKAYTSLTFHSGVLSLRRALPTGATLNSIAVSVTKGSAQATSTNRMAIELASFTGGVRTSHATATANGSSGNETIPMGSLALYIDNAGQAYDLIVTSSAGAGGGTEDYVVDVFLNWTNPGPRS